MYITTVANVFGPRYSQALLIQPLDDIPKLKCASGALRDVKSMREQWVRCVLIPSGIVYGYDFVNIPRPKVITEANLLSMMFDSFPFRRRILFPWLDGREGRLNCLVHRYCAPQVRILYHRPERLELPRHTFNFYDARPIAANMFLRSSFTAGFPLFIEPIYHKFGTDWAISVFGLSATFLIPIPFVLVRQLGLGGGCRER